MAASPLRPLDGWAVVPHLAGMPLVEARAVARLAGVVLTSGNADGPSLEVLASAGTWVVSRQWTPPGARVPFGSLVVVELFRTGGGGGGSAGDREPRQPYPPAGMLPIRLVPRPAPERHLVLFPSL